MNKYLVFYSILILSIMFTDLVAENRDTQGSFLDFDAILSGWESTYGSIRSMRVSYKNLLIDYRPPATNSGESIPNPVKYNHVERIEAGKRYHIRYSLAPDGLDNHEWLVEYAFNGETTQRYYGGTRGGMIFLGQRGGSEEDQNSLKSYMFLRNCNAPSYLKDDYPNGIPELMLYFKMGMLRGKISVRSNLEMIAGQSCHVVEIEVPEKETGPARYKDIFWLAHDKGMCLMKYQAWDNNRQDTYKLESEIEIQELAVVPIDGADIWYPIKACGTSWDDQIGTIRKELTVLEFIPNIKVDKDTFQIDFPIGTEVVDRVLGLSYVVGGEGPGGEVAPVREVVSVNEQERVENKPDVNTQKNIESEKISDTEDLKEDKEIDKDNQEPLGYVTHNNRTYEILIPSVIGVTVLGIVGLIIWYKRSVKT